MKLFPVRVFGKRGVGWTMKLIVVLLISALFIYMVAELIFNPLQMGRQEEHTSSQAERNLELLKNRIEEVWEEEKVGGGVSVILGSPTVVYEAETSGKKISTFLIVGFKRSGKTSVSVAQSQTGFGDFIDDTFGKSPTEEISFTKPEKECDGGRSCLCAYGTNINQIEDLKQDSMQKMKCKVLSPGVDFKNGFILIFFTSTTDTSSTGHDLSSIKKVLISKRKNGLLISVPSQNYGKSGEKEGRKTPLSDSDIM